MNELEKYITEHREELERIEDPNVELIWMGVREAIAEPAKVRRLPHPAWWAAAALLLLLIAALLWLQPGPAPEVPSYQLADYYPELADEEKDYRRRIAQKEAELDLSSLRQGHYALILQELDELDRIHQSYLQDLPHSPGNDQLVAVLIRYYERKLNILEKLAKEIEKDEYHEERTLERHI